MVYLHDHGLTLSRRVAYHHNPLPSTLGPGPEPITKRVHRNPLAYNIRKLNPILDIKLPSLESRLSHCDLWNVVFQTVMQYVV